MSPAYSYHRRVLQLLQWHCPPRLWHLKTPVHMLALDGLERRLPRTPSSSGPTATPAEVLGSVCSLIAYTRSWVSDHRRLEPSSARSRSDCGARRSGGPSRSATAVGDERFADVAFDALNADPVATIGAAYDQLGLELSDDAARRMGAWSTENRQGAHGVHDYALEDFGIATDAVREAFRFYTDRFGGETGSPTGSGRGRDR